MQDIPPKKISHYFAKLCSAFCSARQATNEETRGFCNSTDTGNINETELVTIATNHSSNLSTEEAVNADMANAATTLVKVQQKIQQNQLNKYERKVFYYLRNI